MINNKVLGYVLDVTIIVIAGLITYCFIVVIPETICGLLQLP